MVDKRSIYKNSVLTIVTIMIYLIFCYFGTKIFNKQDMIIKLSDINAENILNRIFFDFSLMLLFPIIIVLLSRHRLRKYKLNLSSTYLVYILLGILLLLFILHYDYSVRGFYSLFFFTVIVGFGEEFIFRGFLYNSLKRQNKLLAIIISGIIWGSMHSFLPGVISGNNLSTIILHSLNFVGMGLLMGYYFIYLMEKSNSLLVPILVHAILDYAIGPIGIITAIGVWGYLFIKSKKALKYSIPQ